MIGGLIVPWELVGGFVGGGFGFGGEVEDEALENQSRPSDDAHISESRYGAPAPGGIWMC